MKYKIFITTLLALSWYIFSGVTESFYIICGVLSILITVIILSRINLLKSEILLKFKFKHFSFLFHLIKEIIKSSIEVSILIWTRKPKISHTIGWINCNLLNDFKKVLYANSITLTPGTICIDMHKDKIQIHCLTIDSFDALNKDELLDSIKKL